MGANNLTVSGVTSGCESVGQGGTERLKTIVTQGFPIRETRYLPF